nr:hypothetical protein CFP56_62256 [Quercus suber]
MKRESFRSWGLEATRMRDDFGGFNQTKSCLVGTSDVRQHSSGSDARQRLWRGAPKDLPPTTALPLPPPDQVSSIQDLTVDAEGPTRARKGKEVLPSAKDPHSEDDLTIKDVVYQAKEAKLKSKDGDAKLKAISKEGFQPIDK